MYVLRTPGSKKMHVAAQTVLGAGVPMAWMSMWPGAYPTYVDEARGRRVVDVDGNKYLDFCLGDSAAMAGHGPAATTAAIAKQSDRGLTTMLPTADAIWVAEELARRFGMPMWQFALSATDANRWLLRIARHITGRDKVLVFSHNYHGTVDEVNLILDSSGRVRTRNNNLGAPIDPRLTTRVVEWNDVEALREALSDRQVACVLAEPALTNIGIVPPAPGFHDVLRALTRESGTLLILDETHTFSAGIGGCTHAWELTPDAVCVGKAIGGGVPIGAYGMSHHMWDRLMAVSVENEDTGMIGGTVAGNALSMTAARATLSEVLTEDAFERMSELSEIYCKGLSDMFRAFGLPWHVVQLGARAEFRFGLTVPRSGGDSASMTDNELDEYMHLYCMNRGIILTPFHNMALMSPATTRTDVATLLSTLFGAVSELAD